MSWFDRQDPVTAAAREALLVAAAAAALLALNAASSATAQTPSHAPVTLPAQHTLAPRMHFPAGQEAKIKGLILSRDGDDMLVRDENGSVDLVTLTADTKISSPSGLFKLEKKSRDVTSLLPGLIVEVKGAGGDRSNLVAERISFHSSALRVAEQIAAGDVMLERHVDANTDSIRALKGRINDSLAAISARERDSLAAIDARFDDIDRYDVRDSAVVNFAVGRAELSMNGRRTLDMVADAAARQPAYLIEVTGYADHTGSLPLNQELSDRRADAVVAYLTQVHNVPLRRILNPTGFGESHPVASNGTALGRAMNRRAQVRVLVNRANRP